MDIQELRPILDLMNEQEERLAKKMDEAIDRIKTQNSRIGKCEIAIEGRNIFCQDVQISKERSVIRNRWIIGVLLVVAGLLSGMFYKSKEHASVPIELIYRKTDSTYIMPQIYFRKLGDQEFFEVNETYVKINTDK